MFHLQSNTQHIVNYTDRLAATLSISICVQYLQTTCYHERSYYCSCSRAMQALRSSRNQSKWTWTPLSCSFWHKCFLVSGPHANNRGSGVFSGLIAPIWALKWQNSFSGPLTQVCPAIWLDSAHRVPWGFRLCLPESCNQEAVGDRHAASPLQTSRLNFSNFDLGLICRFQVQ